MVVPKTVALALALAWCASVAAQTQRQPPQPPATKDQQIERAKQRCRENRGVDCDTPEGLKEWVLQERSRAEAVREGSRHLRPRQTRR